MIRKFSEAILLLCNNMGLFSAIILTVWLPGNILTNLVAYNYICIEVSEIGLIRLIMFIEAIFGPIYIGALIYALCKIKQGQKVYYSEAIVVGLKKWISLFAARFVAGILIGLGFIALVVPGIILAVRYSLLDSVVVIEDKYTTEARVRSIELTAGRRWQIFCAFILFFIPFMLLSFVIYLPLEFFESLNNMFMEIVLDCVLDIVYAVIQIVMFLFYWEAIQETVSAESMDMNEGLMASDQS